MRSLLTILVVGICAFVGYTQSQMVDFVVRGNYGKTIQQDALTQAKTMTDLNPGYPATWINDSGYISTQIKSILNGKEITSSGTDGMLTTEQQVILAKLDMGSNVEVEVKYNSTNVVTKESDPQTMKFTVTLIPEVEATYVGGYEALTSYFQEKDIKVIAEQFDQEERLAVVRFVIQEDGRPSDINVVQSSDDDQADQKLIDLVKNMSQWTPAVNASGDNVAQEFELVVGSMIGC